MPVFAPLKKKTFALLYLGFAGGISLVFLSESWLFLVIGWEIITLTTAFMVSQSHRKLGQQYFFLQFVGECLFLYTVILAQTTGYQKVGVISEVWLQNLFIVGVGLKSAIFGLHFWLPPVHSQASPPVSAILSGLTVKIGFVLLWRIIPQENAFLLGLGLIMAIYGGIQALLATDYKVLLAYSTISQLGYIALGIGIGSPLARAGSILHLVAHSLAKSTLFIGSGLWEKAHHTRNIYQFQNSWGKNPLNALATTIGFLSLAGIAPFAGYAGKHLIKLEAEGNLWLLILIQLISFLSVLYSLRFLWWGLFKNRSNFTLQKEVQKSNLSFQLLIATFILLILGIWPSTFSALLGIETDGLFLWSFQKILSNLIPLVTGGLLLFWLGGLSVRPKKAPSLDFLFQGTYTCCYRISRRCFQLLDSEKWIKEGLGGGILLLSQKIYRIVFTSFSNQLLLIPILLFLLLLLARIK